jgi:hypothetical protein
MTNHFRIKSRKGYLYALLAHCDDFLDPEDENHANLSLVLSDVYLKQFPLAGIGLCIAKDILALGANVAVVSRSAENVKSTAGKNAIMMSLPWMSPFVNGYKKKAHRIKCWNFIPNKCIAIPAQYMSQNRL